MRLFVAAALCAAQIASAANAAGFEADRNLVGQQRGTFAGARIRIPLGATPERAHAGLALTTLQREAGRADLRFAKGLEFGFAGDDKLRLSLHGRPVSRLTTGGSAAPGTKHGVSTLGWVGIGLGVAAVGFLGFAYWVYKESDERNCKC
jgi:hypothetical protein